MAILKLKVKKVRMKNLQLDLMGYAARVITNGKADYDMIAKSTSRNTTLHHAELKAALEMCMETVADLLKEGYIVDLGPVGRLYPSCNSQWAAKEEDLLLANVRPTLYFHPADELNSAVRGATLAWAKASDEEEDDEEGSAPPSSGGDGQSGTTPPSGGGGTGSGGQGQGGGQTPPDNGGDDGME